MILPASFFESAGTGIGMADADDGAWKGSRAKTSVTSNLDLDGVFALMDEDMAADTDMGTVAHDAEAKTITCRVNVFTTDGKEEVEERLIKYALHGVKDGHLCLIECPTHAWAADAVQAAVAFAQDRADAVCHEYDTKDDDYNDKNGWLVREARRHTGGVPDGSALFRPISCLHLCNGNVAVMLVNGHEPELEVMSFTVEVTATLECAFMTDVTEHLRCREGMK